MTRPPKRPGLKAVPPLGTLDDEVVAWAEASSGLGRNLRSHPQYQAALDAARECLRQTERLIRALEQQ